MAENETNYLGPITNITDNGKKYYISLENIAAIQDKIGEILNSLAAKEAADTTKGDAEKHAVYTVEARKHLEELYTLLKSDDESDTIINKLEEVLAFFNGTAEGETLVDFITGLNVEQIGADSKYIKFVSQENGQLAAIAESFDTSVNSSSTDNNAPTARAVNTAITEAINALDVSEIGSDGNYIKKVSETDGKVSVTKQAFDTSVNSSSTDNNAPTSKAVYTAITDAVNALDVSEVGSDGNYIKKVSEADGKVSVTKQAFDTSISSSSTDNNAPTSKAVNAAIVDAINTLDVSNITSNLSASKTLTALSETDGKIAATATDISIASSQINDKTNSYSETGETAVTGKAIKAALETLDITDISNTADKTVKKLTETDGKIGAEFQDIQIAESQVTNLIDDLDNKQDNLDTQTAYSAKGSSYKVPQITTNTLGQITLIEEKDISTASIDDTSGSELISVSDENTTKTLNVVTRDTDQTITGNKTFNNSLTVWSSAIGNIVIDDAGIRVGSAGVEYNDSKVLAGTFNAKSYTAGDNSNGESQTNNFTTYGIRDVKVHTFNSSNGQVANYTLILPTKDGTVAIDEDVVHKTGNETINGTKYFVFEPNGSPAYTRKISLQPYESGGSNKIVHTIDNGATNYKLALPSKDGTLAIDEAVIHKTGDETITGNKTFSEENGNSSVSINSTGVSISSTSNTFADLWYEATDDSCKIAASKDLNDGSNGWVGASLETGIDSTNTRDVGKLSFITDSSYAPSSITLEPTVNASGDYVLTLPAQSGTLATLDDITGGSNSNLVTTNTDQTNITGVKEFYNLVTRGGPGGSNPGVNDIGKITFKGVSGLSSSSTTLKAHTNGGSSESYSILLPAKSGTLVIDDDAVHKAGNETISGLKTFSNYSTFEKDVNIGTASSNAHLLFFAGDSNNQHYTILQPSTSTARTTLTLPAKTGTLACLYKHYIWISYEEGEDNYDDYFSIISPIANTATTGTALISLFDSALSIVFKGTMYSGNWDTTANAQVLDWGSTQTSSTISLHVYWTRGGTGSLTGVVGSYSIPTGGGGSFNDSVTPIS